MFFRVKPPGPCRYLQLVENTRDGTATRQRVLGTLGRVDDAATNKTLDALLESRARFSDTALLISSLQSGTLETSASVRGQSHIRPPEDPCGSDRWRIRRSKHLQHRS